MSGYVRVILGEKAMIIIQDDFFEIQLFQKDTKLKKNIAYIMDGGEFVKIYRGKYKGKLDSVLPGLYKDGENLIEIEPPQNEKDDYHIRHIKELNVDQIFETVEKNESDFIQPEDIEVINNNAEVYVPTIKEGDDFLKYLVKRIIIDKKINLKNYKGRFSNHYALTNMKSGLNRSTKMTVTNFKMWCEILGVKFTMTVEDSGEDTLSPLPSPVKITSDDF